MMRIDDLCAEVCRVFDTQPSQSMLESGIYEYLALRGLAFLDLEDAWRAVMDRIAQKTQSTWRLRRSWSKEVELVVTPEGECETTLLLPRCRNDADLFRRSVEVYLSWRRLR